jgi:hypothetical protein
LLRPTLHRAFWRSVFPRENLGNGRVPTGQVFFEAHTGEEWSNCCVMREGCWLLEMVRTNEQLPDDAQVN